MTFRLWLAFACVSVVGAFGQDANQERLNQYRNLGKAFYENPSTPKEAVAQFKLALDLAPGSNREKLNYGLALLRAGRTAEALSLLQEVQAADPNIPHTWFNLGIAYKIDGQAAAAQAQFERLAQLAPNEAKVHYHLGSFAAQAGRTAEAIGRFERAAAIDATLAAAQFQLYNAYRQAGRETEAAAALARFQALRAAAQNSATPEDVDWSDFSEIYEGPRNRVRAATPVSTVEGRESLLRFPGAIGVAALDLNRTGSANLVAWSSTAIRMYRGGARVIPDNGLGRLEGVIQAVPGDFNNDGWMDLCVLTTIGPVLYRNRFGRFVRQPPLRTAGTFDAAVWVDFDHDYDLDLLLFGQNSMVLRNEGAAGFNERAGAFPFAVGRVLGVTKTRVMPDSKAFDLVVTYRDEPAIVYRDQLGGRYTAGPLDGPIPVLNQLNADFNADGRTDGASLVAEGVRVVSGRAAPQSRWVSIRLQGVKSFKLAQDAEVEVRAGSFYAKQSYAGVPLVFDVGDHRTIDTVRITWPNGLIQNETRQATNRRYFYREAQRLSGSCPMIWTWNGKEFQFITDVLGVAPLGASDGEGSYFPVDHDEYVVIPGNALVARDGSYEVRITEELSEVSYLDQIELIAVDHPAGTGIVTNEKFKGPPYPEHHVFTPAKRIRPRRAFDDAGSDVLALIAANDRRYPSNFKRSSLGVAGRHHLELDFGTAMASGRGVLFLTGWVDWPDGSTFRAAAQESKEGLITPRLEMLDAEGTWQLVDADMGMPAGKPKTIAVAMRFPGTSRRLRIVTNLCVYWDEVWAGDDNGDQALQRSVPLLAADLHYRGFAAAHIDPLRQQPDTYSYLPVSPTSLWNPTAGLYTRYGDVRSVLGSVDDQLALVGAGDEIALRFDANALPPVEDGWIRDFLLKVDGWAKDRDPNTAYSSTVEPLPFHGMSQYPYPAAEHFPSDAAHDQYRQTFNTRPALRLIRRLDTP